MTEPNDCGREHPQPFCLCLACARRAAELEAKGDCLLSQHDLQLLNARRLLLRQASELPAPPTAERERR
jgi:hypothetical protein